MDKNQLPNENRQVVEHINTSQIIPLDYMRNRPNTLLIIILILLAFVVGLMTYGWIKDKKLDQIRALQIEQQLSPIKGIDASIDSLEQKQTITLKQIQDSRDQLDKLEKVLTDSKKEELTLPEALKILDGL